MYIHLLKNLKVTTKEKLSIITQEKQYSKNILTINTKQKLVDLINYEIEHDAFTEKHEFLVEESNVWSFFLDIDAKIEECNLNYNEINQDLNQTIDLVLNEILNDNFIITHVKDTDYKVISAKECYDMAIQKIRITKSNDPHKISFHVFIRNLVFPISNIKMVKKIIIAFKKKNLTYLSQFIDAQPYRENTNFRFIYSTKNGSNYYHMPNDDNDITVDNIELYRISGYQKEYISLEYQHKFDKIKDIIYDTYDVDENNIYIKIHTGGTIFNTFFNKLMIHNEYSNQIIFDFDIKKKLNTIIKNSLTFYFNYDKVDLCQFCQTKKHKNKHRLILTNLGFIIEKLGIRSNCRVIVHKYPRLNEIDLLVFLRDIGRLKKLDKSVISFSNEDGWSYGKQSIKKALLDIKYLDTKDSNMIIKSTNMGEIIDLIDLETIYQMTYGYFKIKKYILNIFSKELIPIKDSEHLIVINNMPSFEYKSEDSYTDDERKTYGKLMDIINAIQPLEFQDRKLFESIVGSCILSLHKPFIVFLRGETRCGKSTIMRLIKGAVGIENTTQLDHEILYKKSPASKPNPSLASINYKLVAHIPELPDGEIIRGICVKKMTERYIINSMKYSNEHLQRCICTILADTNFVSLENDEAVDERSIIIDCNQKFTKPDKYDNLIKTIKNNENRIDFNLRFDIDKGIFDAYMFNFSCRMAKKYHHLALLMEPSYNKLPRNILKDFISKTMIPSIDFVNLDFIIDEKKENYIVSEIRIDSKNKFYCLSIKKPYVLQIIDELKHILNCISVSDIINYIQKTNEEFHCVYAKDINLEVFHKLKHSKNYEFLLKMYNENSNIK